MYSSDITRNDFFHEHCVPQHKTSTSFDSTFSGINYTDYPSDVSGYQQTPLNIYNNYNPNYHHHHYYYPNFHNFQDYGYQNTTDHNWIKKYESDSQKDIFNPSTPASTDYCEFEVPQQSVTTSKSIEKSIADIDRFYSDNLISSTKSPKEVINDNNNYMDSYENFDVWENEKKVVKNEKGHEKIKNNENVKGSGKDYKRDDDISDLGEKKLILMQN